MKLNILFAIGTAALWFGAYFGLRGIYLLVRSFTGPMLRQPGIGKSLGVGVGLLVLGIVATSPIAKSSYAIPLVWFIMPWTAWLIVGILAFAATKLARGFTATSGSGEGLTVPMGIGLGLCVAILSLLYLRDDSPEKITILTGGINLSIAKFVLTLCLAAAAVVLMALASHSMKARVVSKTIVTQATLLVGTVVFGLPFAYLLITSFKEDRDMVSKDGKLIWIPRVTDTVPYLPSDPSKKHYLTLFEGRQVEAIAIRQEGVNLRMDIFRPIGQRGITFLAKKTELKETPIEAKVFTGKIGETVVTGFEAENFSDGRKQLEILSPPEMKGKVETVDGANFEPVRHLGLRTDNYREALEYLPAETLMGWVYLKNTLILVVLNVIGTLLASSIVAYAFARINFPGRSTLFGIVLSTMALPGAITMLPQFLIYRSLGWVDTLQPLWVPAFFGSAFNIFLLRQFFGQIPTELEDAAKIDGCSFFRTFWGVMVPQIKPALAVIAVWTFMGTWNNFQGPLIYINSPENMPLSYALTLFKGDRINEPGMLMAFSTLTVLPVVLLFFIAQRYIIENVSLSGLGGR